MGGPKGRPFLITERTTTQTFPAGPGGSPGNAVFTSHSGRERRGRELALSPPARQSGRVTEALGAVRSVAARFGAGEATVQDMWAAFSSNLQALIADGPLKGDLAALFLELETWESASGDERDAAVKVARTIAARVGRPSS